MDIKRIIIGDIQLKIKLTKEDIMHEEFELVIDYMDNICQELEIEKNKVSIEIDSNKVAKDSLLSRLYEILQRGYEVDLCFNGSDYNTKGQVH